MSARWRSVLAAVFFVVAVAATVLGGVQASGSGGSPETATPVPVSGPALPGSSGVDAPVPPLVVGDRPPVFAPSAVVPRPATVAPPVERFPTAGSGSTPAPRPPRRSGSGDEAGRRAPEAGRAPSSGETQFEYGCRQGYITEGC